MALLKDIAADVGVSVSVVSRVLNDRMGNTRIRAELAERIRATARSMGYEPNPAAVALSRGKQNVLGVFIHRVGVEGSGIIERTIEGISGAARVAGQRLTTSFYASQDEFRGLRPLMRRDVMDGMLIIGKPYPELLPQLQKIRKSGLPVATLHHEALHDDIPNAGLSQHTVGRMATAHLIAQGCQKVAHIAGLPARRTGYRQALKQACMAYRAERVVVSVDLVPEDPTAEFGPLSGERAVRRLLENTVDFDGLVTQSDAQAIGAINELARQGIDVPGQVKVIGVDDSPHCPLCRIPLTSISQLYMQRAEKAVELLLKQTEGQRVDSVEMQPMLVQRDSTAC